LWVFVGLRGPTVFHGETSINLDAKGRLAIPTRYRDAISESSSDQLILTINPFDTNHNLWLYPLPEWERVQRQVMALSTSNETHRWVQRFLVGSAARCDLDSAGRILIPGPQREFAGLSKKIALLGLGHRFELWDDATWNALRNQQLEGGLESGGQASMELDGLSL